MRARQASSTWWLGVVVRARARVEAGVRLRVRLRMRLTLKVGARLRARKVNRAARSLESYDGRDGRARRGGRRSLAVTAGKQGEADAGSTMHGPTAWANCKLRL